MRQYCILYKREDMSDFVRLTPAVDANLYDKPGVTKAINFLRDNEDVAAVAVRVGNELFNVTAFTNEAEAPRSFKF